MLTRQLLRVTASARLLVLLAMGAPILWARDTAALLGLVGIACLWCIVQVCSSVDRLNRWGQPSVEAATVAVLCAVSLDSSTAVLAALAVAPFVAGLRSGLVGVAFVSVIQVVLVVGIGLLRTHGLDADESLAVFTWTVAGVGMGFISTFVRSAIVVERDEVLPYLEAQSLIRELIDISGGLRSGLDVTSLGGLTLSKVRDKLPTNALGLYVPRGEILTPLVTEGYDVRSGIDVAAVESVAAEAWARTETISDDRGFAFPLGETAVVAGTLSRAAGLPREEIHAAIGAALRDLRVTAVQLDTALLFSDFRDSATADVRTRLAREMHDGVAQDIASLGYLVDALASRPATPKQEEQFAMLRDRITKIVAEVRQSVLTLRTSIGESESLGAAISAVARHLSESSQVPIQVRLDEHSTRLRSEVEAELFRIAQEAMNNAVKHARCTAIEVTCQVYAPDALITITDNGLGMQQPRSDSHGLKIMRERARLIGADLSIDSRPAGGLVVAVLLDTAGRIPPFSASENAERVGS